MDKQAITVTKREQQRAQAHSAEANELLALIRDAVQLLRRTITRTR